MRDVIIFWDIDGTLISCGSEPIDILTRVCQELLMREPNPLPICDGRTDGDIIAELLANIPNAPTVETVLHHYEQRLAQELGTPKILPWAIELLTDCRANGITNLLLTGNTKKNAETKLRKAGITHEHLAIAGSFCQGYMTRPEIARMANQYVTPNAHVFVVGDTPADIAVTKEIVGASCIAVATGRFSTQELSHAHTVLSALPPYESFIQILQR